MFIPSLPELTIGWGVAFKGKKSVVPMSQRAEHYRGYNIDGNTQGRGWSVEVRPVTPDLPILRRAVFA